MPGLWLVPANLAMSTIDLALMPMAGREFKLRNALREAEKSYDFVVMDAPPSFGLLNLNALMAANDLITPVLADFLSYDGLRLLFETIQGLEEDLSHQLENIFICVNAFNQTFRIAREALDALREHYAEYLLHSVVRQCTKFAQASSEGCPVFGYDPDSKGAMDIEAMQLEVLGRIRDGLAARRRGARSATMRKAFDANVPKLKPRLRPAGVATLEPEAAPSSAGGRGAGTPVAAEAPAVAAPVVEAPPPERRPHPCPRRRAAGARRDRAAARAADAGPPPAPPRATSPSARSGSRRSSARWPRRPAAARRPWRRASPPAPPRARSRWSATSTGSWPAPASWRRRSAPTCTRPAPSSPAPPATPRRSRERLAALEKELEERRGMMAEMLAEMTALEEERDQSVRRAQALAALDEERQRLADELSRRGDELEAALAGRARRGGSGSPPSSTSEPPTGPGCGPASPRPCGSGTRWPASSPPSAPSGTSCSRPAGAREGARGALPGAVA